MSADYEYTGLVAQAWDLLRGDTSAWPDRPFYRALIERHGGPALDVGGTGRLLLDYLDRGLDIEGVDNSPEMLDLCRAKAAERGVDVNGRLHHQGMDALSLSRRYGVILVPSSSFQLLTDETSAAAALGRFREHRRWAASGHVDHVGKLGGSPHAQMRGPNCNIGPNRPRGDGTAIRRWIWTRYDHDAQLEHEENRYEVLRDGEVVATDFTA